MIFSNTNDHPWILTACYFKIFGWVRRNLWVELNRVLDLKIPTLIAGDFNCSLTAEEKMGRAPYHVSWESREF